MNPHFCQNVTMGSNLLSLACPPPPYEVISHRVPTEGSPETAVYSVIQTRISSGFLKDLVGEVQTRLAKMAHMIWPWNWPQYSAVTSPNTQTIW